MTDTQDCSPLLTAVLRHGALPFVEIARGAGVDYPTFLRWVKDPQSHPLAPEDMAKLEAYVQNGFK